MTYSALFHQQNRTGTRSPPLFDFYSDSDDDFDLDSDALDCQNLTILAEWRENKVSTPSSISDQWTMYFDGSLELGGGGAGILFISPKGEQLKYVFQILFEVSNNKEWDINKETMDAYVVEIRKLKNKFLGLKIHHVVRDNNVAADIHVVCDNKFSGLC